MLRAARYVALGALLTFTTIYGIGVAIRRPANALAATPPPTATVAPLACNGSPLLCDRPVDQVAFAATHNSMNSAALGWLWPNQAEDIPTQLQHGIRGFLIDTHYWETPAETTAFASELTPPQRETFAAAARGVPGAEHVYLCHMMCAGGSIGFTDTLRTFGDFLARHPDQVVILDIEDHVTPADTEAAFRASGLLRHVYVHQADTPWPTLRALIVTHRQVIVEAENHGTPSTWYGSMYRDAWDTSYHVVDPAGFDCAVLRGSPDHQLLLLNHWIARRSPDPADAANVNRFDALMAHAHACQVAHAKTPNLVAVDFASVGDLGRVVATLNGLDSGS